MLTTSPRGRVLGLVFVCVMRAESGRVGVWSKVDAVSYFDDFRVTGKPEHSLK